MRPFPRVAIFAALALVLAAADLVRAAGLERSRYQSYPELEGKLVRQVLVLGNNHTRDVVFRREMVLTEGVPFHSDQLWRDWARIVDLGIFAEVEVEAVPSGDGVLVVVSVYERPSWFITPTVDYNIDARDLTVGYRLRARNLDGLNRTFRSTARAGAASRFSASWEWPWLGTSPQTLGLALDVELPQRHVDELRTSGLTVVTTRYLGDYPQTRRGLTIFSRLEYLQRDGTSPSGAVEQLSPTVGAGFFRDRRDLRVDPSRGTVTSAFGELVSGWLTDDLSYFRSTLDGRGFLSLGHGFVVASRVTSVFTTGDVPEYRRVGVGGKQSIRGQPDGIETGNSIARASMELRFPLLSRKKFNLPVPFVPKRISNVDLRIDGEIFVDGGSAWEDNVGFRNARFRNGAGVGLRVFLPILEVARFELAFDEAGNPSVSLAEGNLI